MSDSMIKRMSTVLLIILILIGFNAVVNVSADWDKYPNDGIWIDEFDNLSDIDMSSSRNFELNDSKIILAQGEPVTTYNHSSHPDNVKAWSQSFGISGNLVASALTTLIKPDIFPGDPIKEAELKNIDKLDNKIIETASTFIAGTDIAFTPIHHFQFKVNQKIENIKNITIKWWFGEYKSDAHLKEIRLWVWNYKNVIENWVPKGTITYNETNILNQESNPDISVTLTSTDFVSDDGCIDIVISGIPKENLKSRFGEQPVLHTDWIQLDVSMPYGYLPEGILTTNEISPTTDFGGWESVFWDGSKPSQTTEIEIQILDVNNTVIKEFEKATSPVDISSITNTTIKLRAILKSYSSDVTPFLKSWGISWQRTDGYNDSFTHTYRLSETKGVEIQGGNIEINKFYSDWNTFGKNPANTRSYDGAGLPSKINDIYWQSMVNDVGGGFKQIVAANGKIFAPSADKRIYSFNITRDTPGSQRQYPANYSRANYTVDECIGSSDNYLIIGTCTENSVNKIYALSLSNLSHEVWVRTISGEPICFSSPPTIYDNKVFLTSWSGKKWDIPILSIFNDFLNNNNKLIALDITTGNSIWDPIDLPAASFSSPVIANDMVIVGCQNMWGKSLFAYDIETGKEVWNASVGIIGRASPLYADGKIFVLSREKDNITSLGRNKVVAINADTGEEVWNISIGNVTFSSIFNINMLKGLKYYSMLTGFAPIASPAYQDDTLFVLSQDGKLLAINPENGKIKWNYKLDKDHWNSYYVASPLIVSNELYVINGDAKIYAFNVKNTGNETKPLWTHQINLSQYTPPQTPDVAASPIVADGLMFISCTEETYNMTGSIYSIGAYSPNYKGTVTSKDIHLPDGYWWNKFNADFNDTENNTIKFTILDDNGNEIPVNGSNNDLSGIRSNLIKLKAALTIKNSSEATPVLKSWSITWKPERGKPKFIESSFKPGQESWTNQLTPTCSIEVEDEGENGVISGLDVDSAQFRIDYKQSNKILTSDWYQATSYDELGVNKTTIYANIGELDLDIDELRNLTFKISDLAGNEETFTRHDFKFDFEKPTSNISNAEEINNKEFNDIFTIKANANDSKSGVYSVVLKYKYRKTSRDQWSDEWTNYGSPLTSEPYNWTFETTKSGWYQVVSVATDLADNEELATSDRAVQFKFDMVTPLLDSADLITSPNVIPKVKVTISDDLELESFEYSFNQINWNLIKDNINADKYTTTWTMDENVWKNMVGNDTKNLYFRITDSLGNIYVSNSPELVLQKGENASSYYIDVSDFSQWHWDNKFTISVEFPEDSKVKSVALYYKYSKNNKDWPENYTLYNNKSNESSYKWTMTPPKDSGYYKFKAVIEDASGVVYEATEGVNVTMFPTTLFLILIVILIALLLVATVVIIKMKKKKRVN